MIVMENLQKQKIIDKSTLKVVAIMEKEYAEPALMQKLVSSPELEETQLKNGFEIMFGLSPEQYLAKIRMKKAVELLNQQLSVAQVYQACGFQHVSEFNQVFEAHFGITPYQYLLEKTQSKSSSLFF